MATAWGFVCRCWGWWITNFLRLVEGLTILGIFSVATYAAWWIVAGDPSKPQYLRMVALLSLVSTNWKVFLILGVLISYRSVRTFVDEVTDIASVKRKKSPPQVQEPAKNPAGPPTGGQ